MMMKSVFDNSLAFRPFYDQQVAVRISRDTRTLAVSLDACVLDGGLVDADSDAVSTSPEHFYTVSVLREDWPDETWPRRGDEITLSGGQVLKVTGVEVENDAFVLSAKSKGGPAT